MKILINIAPLLLLILACKMCNYSGKTMTASELNPYRGTLEALMPKEKTMGVLKFKQTSISHSTFPKAEDAVDVVYEQAAGSIVVPIQIKVVNFESALAATAAMQFAAKDKNLLVESKSKGGRSIGQRFTDQNGKAIAWTNGSLLCIAYSQFAKATSNLEEALPF